MSAQGARVLAAAPGVVGGLLLRPLALPEWNPAFTAIGGSATATVGERHPLSATGGLRGEFRYTEISPTRIGMAWEVPGMRETCTWTLEAVPGGTRVTHDVERHGPLAFALRGALARLPGLRLDRLGAAVTA